MARELNQEFGLGVGIPAASILVAAIRRRAAARPVAADGTARRRDDPFADSKQQNYLSTDSR